MSGLEGVQFVDRYMLLEVRPPSVFSMCVGRCEGLGVAMVNLAEEPSHSPSSLRAGVCLDCVHHAYALLEHQRGIGCNAPPDGVCDGWHAVRCLRCNGSGRANGWDRVRRFVRGVRTTAVFAKRHVFVRPYRKASMSHEKDAPYADRLDVPHPWLWNRRAALRVLFGGRR